MSLLVLDDQLDVLTVLSGLRRWASVLRLQALRPGAHILDDRVPEILLTCRSACRRTGSSKPTPPAPSCESRPNDALTLQVR